MNASQPESSASPLAQNPVSAPPNYDAAEAGRLRQQFAHGNLAGLREYLARTRQSNAWHDRILMLDALAPTIPLDVLETICVIDPNPADLALVRCAWYAANAVQLRGTGPLEEVPEVRLRKAAISVRVAFAALEAAAKFDPVDPTPYACIMPALAIFEQHKIAMQRVFLHATTLAPELGPLLSFGTAATFSTRTN